MCVAHDAKKRRVVNLRGTLKSVTEICIQTMAISRASFEEKKIFTLLV